jgi:hypothetical protein
MAKSDGAPLTTEAKVRALLVRHRCPTAYHQVRTLFLGAIASPVNLSPINELKRLWGGELPAFDSIDDANELMAALIMGLWNQLTQHSDPDLPVRLTKIEHRVSDAGLRAFAATRKEEIAAFLTGFYGGRISVKVPDDVDHALNVLAEIGGMFEGIVNLPKEPDTAKAMAEISSILVKLDQMTDIAEIEMHRVSVSGAAQRGGGPSPRPAAKRQRH